MASTSSSTPSEGEIVESNLEKAKPSHIDVRDTSVDRQSRNRASVSRSPTPARSTRKYRSRTRSRSPYREPRGSKRPRDEPRPEHSRDDPRRFKVRYEDRTFEDRRRPRDRYEDLDRYREPTQNLRYDDRGIGGQPGDKRRRTRSHSPRPARSAPSHGPGLRGVHGNRLEDRTWPERGAKGHTGSNSRLSKEQSVSDRGHSSVAAGNERREAETAESQKRYTTKPESNPSVSAAELNGQADDHFAPVDQQQPLNEAALIEERRKRREIIKARHRGQAIPLLAQALGTDKASATLEATIASPLAQDHNSVSPRPSPPATPKELLGQESPAAIVVTNDTDLINEVATADGAAREDEPSAADYDPTMDMQEDKIRQTQYSRKDDVPSAAYDETVAVDQDVLLPDSQVDQPQLVSTAPKRPKDELDMFADEDEIDMFADAPPAPGAEEVSKGSAKAVPVPSAKAFDTTMIDDWDDPDGYYKVILGELLGGRYQVHSNLGKGMFSGVVRATDQETKGLVAIKIIRKNETMRKAGAKEIEILQKLSHADPDDKKHVIRLERSFEHKGHLCMVFENLSINLREVLKKFGRDVGINLKAVRAYAQQMLLGLSLLRKCNILHADLKPDNVLVNDSRNMLKICDLGSASDASENDITQYLVSRFYRAPEIILGIPYDFGIDVWSIGCTLFELYTGKILFTGRSNNQMLRTIMECRGKFSHKILRKAQFAGLHFDDLLNFRSVEKDRLTNKDTVRILSFTKPTRDLKTRLMVNAKGLDESELKELHLFVDLLDRCLNLNPEKRCTPNEALKHPFIARIK